MRAAALAVLVAAVALAGVAATSSPVLRGRASWDDARYQTQLVPPRLAAAHAIAEGRLPHWWDGSGLGVPLSAEPRHAALYPPSWLGPSGWAVDLIGLLHAALLGVALSGLAAAAWRSAHGSSLSSSARLVAAALPAVSGLATAALVGGQLASLAWLAVALGLGSGWGRAAEPEAGSPAARGRPFPSRVLARCAALAVALAGVALAGSPGLAPIAVALVALEIAAASTAPRRWGWLALAVALGGLLAAAQLVPWCALASSGDLAGASLTGAGSTMAGWPARSTSLAVAAPLVALGLAGRRWRWLISAAILAGAAALAGGPDAAPSWLAALALEPASLAAVAALLLLGAALLGSARLAEQLAPSRPRQARALGPLFTLGLAAAAAALAPPVSWRDRAALDALPAWLAPSLPGPLAEAQRAGAPIRVFCPPPVSRRGAASRDPGEPLRTAGAIARGWSCAQSLDRARAVTEDDLWSRGAGLGGRLLRRASISLAIVPSSTVNAVGFRELGRDGIWSLVALAARPLAAVYPTPSPARDGAAALAAVLPPPGRPGATTHQLVVEGLAPSRQIPPPSPARSLPAPLAPAPDEQTAEVPHDHLAHEPVPLADPLPAVAEPSPEPCQLRSWRPGAVELRCPPPSSAAAVAAIASAWAPGWQVTVDGEPRPVLRVEAALRGVALSQPPSATASEISWRYQPPAWPLGRALTLAGLAGLVACIAFALLGARWAIVQRRR